MVARGAIVNESDDLIPELTMLENAVGDEPAQLARPGNQNALEADARAPATLERLAHELARRIGQDDVQNEEDAPDGLRHFIFAAGLGRGTRPIDLYVQREHDAEDDRENRSDEHREEIVDAGSTAAQ